MRNRGVMNRDFPNGPEPCVLTSSSFKKPAFCTCLASITLSSNRLSLKSKMACVTLKRPIDVLGSPHLAEHQPMAKRKRCGPSLFPTTPPCSPSRGLGVKRIKRRLEVDDHYSPPSTSSTTVSPFANAAPPIQTGKSTFLLRSQKIAIGCDL